MPDNRHDAELRIVQITGYRQFDGDLTFGIFEQGHRQADRQVNRIRAVDFLAQLQLLYDHLVLGLELSLGDDVMQIDVQAALTDAETGELA
ncbi:hypothetical protein D3C77_741250 [compost metagenome]